MSDQKIGQIVSTKALQFSQDIYESTILTLDKSKPDVVRVNPRVNIYQPESKEILLFADRIQVKGQKEQRQAKNKVSQGVESLIAPVITTPAVLRALF